MITASVVDATAVMAVAVPVGIFADVHPIVFVAATGTAASVMWGIVLGGDGVRSRIMATAGRSDRQVHGHFDPGLHRRLVWIS
jgi:hypothetical protein